MVVAEGGLPRNRGGFAKTKLALMTRFICGWRLGPKIKRKKRCAPTTASPKAFLALSPDPPLP